jgi:hypothetical protein
MPKMSRPVQQPAKPMGQNAGRSINRLGGAAFGSFVGMSSAALGTGDFYEGPTRPRTERRCSGRGLGDVTRRQFPRRAGITWQPIILLLTAP